MTIYHLARVADWQSATAIGEYRVSTKGLGLDEVGFIHASRVDQVPGVAARFYRDEPGELIVLEIDSSGLDVRDEGPGGEEGLDETFPHIYEALPVGSVVRAIPVRFDDDGLLIFEL